MTGTFVARVLRPHPGFSDHSQGGKVNNLAALNRTEPDWDASYWFTVRDHGNRGARCSSIYYIFGGGCIARRSLRRLHTEACTHACMR